MNPIICLTAILLTLCVSTVAAHTAYMACYDNDDVTVTCFGEFSDGSSAAAIPIKVINNSGTILFQGAMDDLGEFTFIRPDAPFTVIFDAGPGHIVKEKSANISR